MRHPEYINALAAVIIAVMVCVTALIIARDLTSAMVVEKEATVTITNSVVGSKPSAARVTIHRDGKTEVHEVR